MIAYHGKEEVKKKYVERALEHQRLDEIHKGVYFQDGEVGKRKMCAVGCTIHSDNHNAYETELGIPVWLARLEDNIFENLPNKRAKTWPAQFLETVNIGSDLEKIKTPFLIFILEQNLKSMDAVKYDEAAWPDVKKAIELSKAATTQMIEFHKGNGDESAESAAWSAASAESAAWSAESAARSAAWSAASAARSAESVAWSAASAAESARSVAESARSVAWSAASAAESARSVAESARSVAESAASAAWSVAFEMYADKLLELIKETK